MVRGKGGYQIKSESESVCVSKREWKRAETIIATSSHSVSIIIIDHRHTFAVISPIKLLKHGQRARMHLNGGFKFFNGVVKGAFDSMSMKGWWSACIQTKVYLIIVSVIITPPSLVQRSTITTTNQHHLPANITSI